jgi:hypothetical protein
MPRASHQILVRILPILRKKAGSPTYFVRQRALGESPQEPLACRVAGRGHRQGCERRTPSSRCARSSRIIACAKNNVAQLKAWRSLYLDPSWTQVRPPTPKFQRQFIDNKEVSGRGVRIRTGGLLRPRQARYQAALRPDSDCIIHSKALPNLTPNPSRHFRSHCAKTVPNTLLNRGCARIQRHLIGLAVHLLQGLSLHL